MSRRNVTGNTAGNQKGELTPVVVILVGYLGHPSVVVLYLPVIDYLKVPVIV